MAFYTYILRCADGRYYTGHTDDMDVRLAQHRSGHFPGFTSKLLPVTLVWVETFPTRDEAFTAEMIIRKWSRAKKEALMRGDWEAVSFFARPPSERGNLSRLPDGVSTSLDMSGEERAAISDPFMSSEVETPSEQALPRPLPHAGGEDAARPRSSPPQP